MLRLTAIAAAALFTAACETPNGSASPAAHERRPRAAQAAQVTDFRFGDPSCVGDSPALSLPGMMTSDGRNLLAIEPASDQQVTVTELGQGNPPDLNLPGADSLGDVRYVRLAIDDRTHTLLLRGIRSKLPFSVGDKLRYSNWFDSPGGWGLPDYSVTLRAEDGELLLQYGHLSDLEGLELPTSFEADANQEICLLKEPCGGSIRSATFRDDSGASAQIEPGQARSFSGFDIYVYGALVVPDSDISWRGFDCRGDTFDLLLLRNEE